MAATAPDAVTAERPRDNEGSPDGRRLRAERSRKAIVEALITLIRNDEIMPSAERVSEEAKVGLRTVFRHFEDMDSLYQEVGDYVESQIGPLWERPFTATDWRGRLFEALDRRTEVLEWVMPFKRQANARLLQSDYLREKHRCATEAELERLRDLLPAELRKNKTLFHGIAAAISFDVWNRLRHDQGRTPEEARAIVRRMVEALLAAS